MILAVDKLYILDILGYLGDFLATILVKGLPEDVLKELRRLKVELNCKSGAELLEKLVESKEPVLLSEKELDRMRIGVKGFLKLSKVVSRKWSGAPSVLREFRRSRRHGRNN